MRTFGLFIIPFLLFSGMSNGPSGVSDPGNTDTSAFEFTVPNEPNMLFYIQRSVNENTIIYALKLKPDGSINSKDPVDVYWRRYQEDGRREELDFVQRTFVYGLRTKDLGDKIELRCIGFDKMPVYVYKNGAGTAARHAMVVVNEKLMLLDRVFIQINGGTYWFPNVEYAEFSGSDPVNGAPISELYYR
ncbi:MAG: DUF4833 domain-containing protein [Flavobacteriales bacterium]|jgi:hypothetical protein|nr:DUF4833 domain-containing protein [Flavobacteriales bacterium]MBP7154594.1 DUF4833 domain-containing protein [Flavobacteriales bacterium]HQV75172.1 DUF4833 domain-containing protein [Flavobacteriales bacterium]HQW40637.1 DUF4833 domain-containing protein [Flavobacteriales bacterium]